MKRLKKINQRPTEFGHKIWDSTFRLIDFFEKSKFNFNNQAVIEVGCGWGILGIYLSKQFSCNVLCTDIDENVLPITQAHAELNLTSIKTKAQSFKGISDEQLQATDIIVGTEVCYSEDIAHELYNLINRAYKAKVKNIFITDPGRPDFLEKFCHANFNYTKEIYSLPGTINGKITYLLHLKTD